MARAKRGADGYFSVTVTVVDVDGKRIRKRFRSKTLSGLREKQQAHEQQRADGIRHGVKPTVAAFLTSWLEQVVKQRVRPRTHERYSADVKNHITPRLGTILLDKLTTHDVQSLIGALSKSGLAPRSVRNVHATLRQALSTAIDWNLVGRNVATSATLPKAEKPAISALSPEEARRLLAAVRGDRLEALLWCALTLGMRQGELLGLRWQDVDFDAETIQVAGAMQRQKAAKAIVRVPTKTKAGTRLLPMPADLAERLKAHRALQDEERTIDGWQEHGLVFASQIGTPIEATNLVARWFKPALVRAGLPPMPFHGLRHSAATLLLSSGVNHNTVAAILGHGSAGFTLSVYGHALPEVTRTAVAGLGNLLAEEDRVLTLPRRKV